MLETTIPDYARGATLEDVWAVLRENAEQQKKNAAEADERRKELDRLMKDLTKQMGDLHNSFGELAEHLVAPGINDRFNELGYHFSAISPKGLIIKGEDGKIKTEIDLLLQNGETVMAVEVKSKPKVQDIPVHVRRLEILREHLQKFNDQKNIIDLRKVEGAIAGAVFGAEEKKATIEAGLYVIEQSGDTMKIEVPEDFVPRRW